MEDYNKIEIQKLSTSAQEKRYLLVCNEQYYEANYPIVELLTDLQHYPTQEEAISSYISKKEGKYTHEQVTHIITKFIIPLFSNNTEKKRTFLYERGLFSVAAIDKFSDTFYFLFKKVYMLSFLTLTLLLDMHFFLFSEDLLKLNSRIDVYTAIGLLIFMLFSSFFHEVGHASACKYYGIKHGGIGFGLYLNFPVLYTDVTEVWRLGRRQRCIVNIAGVYFQCFCLSVLLIFYQFTGNDMIRYIILIINFGFIITLNPFFKFDGYWIASDLLGVPNLRQRSKELFGYLYKRIRKQSITKRPYLLQINKLEKYCLLAYSVLVNLFMGYYFLYIIPRFITNFVQSFPDEVHQLVLYLSHNMTPPFALLRSIGMQILFLSLLVYLFIRTICSLKKYATHR